MPFQSEKQRKYLWANEPAIAKRWEKYPKGYNTGGVSHLFRSKEDRVGFNAGSWKGNPGTDSRKEVRDAWKDFLKYRKDKGVKNWQEYMPIWIGANLAHGGYVRPEDSGVLGLADGGQLVKPGPGRPGYNGGEMWSPSVGGGGDDEPSWGGGGDDPPSAPQRDPTPVHDYEGEAYGTPDTIASLTTGDGDAREKRISEQYKTKYDKYAGTDLEEQQEIDQRDALRRLQTKNLTRTERKNLEVGLGLRKAKTGGFKQFLKNAALVVIPGLLPAKLAIGWKVGTNIVKYQKGEYDKYIPFSDFKSTGKFSEGIKMTMKENLEKIKANKAKLELYKSLPDGHPEKIALSIELEIGKKPEHLGDGEGDKGPIDITYENIEETNNQKEMIAASKRQYDMTYGTEDRSKQMAYWQSLMAPYMSAKGGRVPGGYNTGGLSNLFRLKNK
jgi:hypothetical protein